MAFIEFKNLHTWFYTDAGIVKAVNGVDFEIRKGETVCVVGESRMWKECYFTLSDASGSVTSGKNRGW
mgnify:CR=1 FL=1